MLFFGLSHNFWTIMASRAFAGATNGNIGVVKSMMGELTDPTNIAQGFALMPIIWSAGSAIG
jgi:predicted MFS family arabinose efflux permease